jgi:hypothetical protein
LSQPELRLVDQPSTSVTAVISAPPEAIWPIITDIGFPAKHSTEFRGAHWLDGATEPSVGARFEGSNANSRIGQWQTISTVTECCEPVGFCWIVGDPDRPLAEWGFRVTPIDRVSAVQQWHRLGLGESGMTWLIGREPEREHEIIAGRFERQRRNMRANLEGIAAALDVSIDHR